MKRLTQKVKVKSNYIEDQEEHLCGKHAIIRAKICMGGGKGIINRW